MNGWCDEETDNLLLADDRNLYKAEKSTRDGMKVDSLRYAGRAQEIFATTVKRRPRTRLTIRQRTRVLQR